MEMLPASTSILRPRITVSVLHSKSPSNLLHFALFFTFLISNATSIPQDFSEIPYSQYCNDVVHESSLTDTQLSPDNFLRLDKAVYSLGFENPLFNFDPSHPQVATFSSRRVYETKSKGIIKVNAFLNLAGPGIVEYLTGNSTRRRLRLVRFRPPRFARIPNAGAGFGLFGFWDSGSGKLCMVGSGSVSSLRSVNVVFKLHYPNSTVLDTSLIKGTLQSIVPAGSVTYFRPVSILGVSQMGYNYSYIDREIESGGFSVYDAMKNLSLSLPDGATVYGHGVCSIMTWGLIFELDYYGYDCNNVSCSFISVGDEILPRFMSIKVVDCLDNGKVRYVLQFSNSSYSKGLPFYPSTSLVAEGAWDEKKKRLALVACRLFDKMDSPNKALIRDCTIRLAFSLPSTLTLNQRSHIVGKLWSTKSFDDSRNFWTVSFRAPGNIHKRINGISYKYTQHEKVDTFCRERLKSRGKKGTYPDGKSLYLRFDMTVRNTKGQIAYGYASPLSVGDKFYAPFSKASAEGNPSNRPSSNSNVNISYVMSFTKHADFDFGSKSPESTMVEISAEGIYNTRSGSICMIACRHMPYEKFQRNRSLDCELLVKINYSPLNGKDGGLVQGTIESTRDKSDPLHFDRLEFGSSSVTTVQARESIWRMDFEITMVLISNTLSCIFIGLQLFYVKKNPTMLPFISVIMLGVLTLAHMIPLLLNFEAIFLANRKQNVFLGTDQWLEVNEVLVRVITMIAFLLQFRLLQLTWSSRNGYEGQQNLWVSDKKVLFLSVPLYIAGGLTAFFAKSLQSSHPKTHYRGGPRRFGAHNIRTRKFTFWGELKSYVGFVLDAFLLPQIVFNLFCDSQEKALAPSFYVGSTVVRMLPHLYDLYRMHSSSWLYSMIYADPGMDYYSTTWDVVICCCAALFALVILVQQRFGGRCFLPERFRGNGLYEKVPVNTIEQ